MTSISHESPTARQAIISPQLWASLAITVMWITVLLDALWGPDIETSNGAGTNTSSVPSAVVIALFAFLANWVVARYAFGRRTI